MNKFLSNFILISSVLILTVSVALYLSTQSRAMLETNKAEKEIFVDDAGKLKYSLGKCDIDSDCVPSGCSSQVCSSNKNIITTCEYSSDFPDPEVYQCGCVENLCSWYK